MGMKKECSCGYWNKEQEECLYNGSGCAKDEQSKPNKDTDKYIMKKGEAVEYIKEFEKYLKKGRGITLTRTEKYRLTRFVYWLYEEGDWTISAM